MTETTRACTVRVYKPRQSPTVSTVPENSTSHRGDHVAAIFEIARASARRRSELLTISVAISLEMERKSPLRLSETDFFIKVWKRGGARLAAARTRQRRDLRYRINTRTRDRAEKFPSAGIELEER